jgi:acyl-coenzyme A thioesterase 13
MTTADPSLQSFDLALMRTHLGLVDAERFPNGMAKVTFSLTVAPDLCSRSGNIHGGAVALIVDMCTTMAQAPVARPGFWEFGGVSRTLTTTYMRPIPMGTEALVVCEVLQVGKALGKCSTVRAPKYCLRL